MQVSTRMVYPEIGLGRSRSTAPRGWAADRVRPVTGDERSSGYRGTLSRGSHQPVNERPPATEWADKEVFVARSLRSTLAILQMHVEPSVHDADPVSKTELAQDAASVSSLVSDLFAGVLGSPTAQ